MMTRQSQTVGEVLRQGTVYGHVSSGEGKNLIRKQQEVFDRSITWEANNPTRWNACEAHKSNYWNMGVPVETTVPQWKVVLTVPKGDWSKAKTSATPIGGINVAFATIPSKNLDLGPSDKFVTDRIASCSEGLVTQAAGSPTNDLMRSIYELKDMKQCFKTMGNLMDFVAKPHLSRTKFPTQRQYNRYLSVLSGSIKNASDAYLGYTFGLDPTIKDLQNWIRTFLIPDSALTPVRRHYAKGTTVRSGGGVDPSRTIGSVEGNARSHYSHSSYLDLFCEPVPGKESYEWIVSPYAAFTNVGFSDASSANAFSSLGLNVITSTHHSLTCFAKLAYDCDINLPSPLVQSMQNAYKRGWDLTPFSFVVDWFADVGGYLDRQDRMRRVKMQGYYLDSGAGVWLSKRSVTKIYYPQLMAQCSYEITDHWPRGGFYPGARIYFTEAFSRQVIWRPVGETLTYSRKKIADNVIMPGLRTRGISDQGWYQATTSAAMLLSNMLKGSTRKGK